MIGKINDIIVFSLVALAHLSVIIESFYKRRYFSQFWDLHEKIKNKTIDLKFINNYMMKLAIFVIFKFLVELSIIWSIYGEDVQWTYYWAANIFSLTTTRMKNVHHTFFIDLIYFYMEDLNLKMKNFKNSSISSQDFKLKIVKLKNEFKILIKMLMIVNEIFAWSQAVNIGQQFIEIVSGFYWIYAYAKSENFFWGKRKKFQ